VTERRSRRRLMNEINVVPYIDVMLVLLVIFMITAPLITPGQIELPEIGKSLAPPVAPLEVIVKADGSLRLHDRSVAGGERKISREELVEAILVRAYHGAALAFPSYVGRRAQLALAASAAARGGRRSAGGHGGQLLPKSFLRIPPLAGGGGGAGSTGRVASSALACSFSGSSSTALRSMERARAFT